MWVPNLKTLISLRANLDKKLRKVARASLPRERRKGLGFTKKCLGHVLTKAEAACLNSAKERPQL